MRLTVAVVAFVVLAVSVATSWWAGAVGCLVSYIAWTFVRIPIERRARLRAFGGEISE
jgi:hypothetical protein